jgi:nucleotide-binding universal stress UspA family protein
VSQAAGEMGSAAGSAVLVGVANPDNVGRLVALATLVAGDGGSEIIAVAVVTVPPQLPLEAGRSGERTRHAQQLVRQAAGHAKGLGASARGLVEVGRTVHEALLDAADQVGARIIVLGFSPLEDADKRKERDFDRVTDRVAAASRAPVVIASLVPGREIEEIRTVLVPMDERLDVRVCADLLRAGIAAGWQCTFLARAPDDASRDQQEEVRSHAAASLAEAGLEGRGEIEVRCASNPVVLATDLAPRFDATVMGAPAETVGERLLGSVAERIAQGSTNTVFIVRAP